MTLPETRYADCNGYNIAYQVTGEGPQDIIIAPGMISHVELLHDFPGYTRYIRRLGEFGRVITFDKRGQGLSDALDGVPSLEERVQDMCAVLDACGSKRVAVYGFSEGAPMAFLLAATYPDRVSHIVVFGGYAKATAAPDYPHMFEAEIRRRNLGKWLADWGKGGGVALSILAPALSENAPLKSTFARIERYVSTPNAMRRYFEINFRLDARAVLSLVQCPTLVLHRKDDNQVPYSAGQHLAEVLALGEFEDAGEGGHLFWAGDTEHQLSRVREFLTGEKLGETSSNRCLATVLFTDLVGSTKLLQELGDGVWRDLLDRHDSMAAEILSLHGGRLLRSTGDGVLATFDGPGRAVESALRFRDRLSEIGLSIRAGIHTGEVELRDGGVDGASVHIAARIEALADSDTVFVSRTVTDLMVGNSDVAFESKGTFPLKGVSGSWELFQAIG